MAIVKMKKLRLMAVRSRKEELLRQLVKLGCVEFSEIGEQMQEAEAQGTLARESGGLMALRARQTALDQAISLLDKYAPAKSKLLSAKPELSDEVLLDSSGVEAALTLARGISDRDDAIKRMAAEESRLRSTVEALLPWQELELPLETSGTERTELVLGTVPARISLDAVQEALGEAADEAELFPVSDDKSQHYLVLLCLKEQLAAAQECLRSFGFTAFSPGITGTARQGIANAEAGLKALAEQKTAAQEELKALAVHREELKLASDQVSVQIALAEAEDRLYGTETTVIMEGWMPAEREEELAQVFDRYDCAWESRDPEEDEYPSVPVKLKNNAFSNALNMVTNMYSLPAYGSVDANPIMAPFFILFYGLMMADMGYGLIMMAAALVAMKKIKPREGTLSFCQLLLYGGISTFIMGALTGGLFGDAPYVLVHMFNPQSTWEGLPALFSPVNDSTLVLYGAMVLGLIHLNVGMIVSFVEKARAGHLADGIWEEGSLWVMLLGGILLGLQMLVFQDAAALRTAGLAVLIVGVVMLLFGAGRNSKGVFGKLGAAFGCIYNTATGWFGDVLSYSRIMALMLAGGVVAQVFNTIAAMPANASGVNAITIIVFLLIFLVGHALNFGLNLLGCFVHDLRLQCLEFFGKFYQDGGKPFQPLRLKTRYAVPKEN